MKNNIYINYLLSITMILVFYNVFLININNLFIPSIIISYIIGYILLYLFSKIKLNLNFIKLLILILVALIIYNYSKQISIFYLKETNIIFILLSLLIIGIYISFKDLNNISLLLFYFSIISIIFIILFNLKNYNVSHLVNYAFSSNDNFKNILLLSGLSTILNIIYMSFYRVSFKNISISYFLSFITILFLSISIVSTLGITLTRNSIYPFYLSLRKIQLLNFIERIENIMYSFTIFNVVFILSFLFFLIRKKS